MSTTEYWGVFGNSESRWYALYKNDGSFVTLNQVEELLKETHQYQEDLAGHSIASFMDPDDVRLYVLVSDNSKDTYLQLSVPDNYTLEPAKFSGCFIVLEPEQHEIDIFTKLDAPLEVCYPRNYKKKRRA